jgi:hypothetical protein
VHALMNCYCLLLINCWACNAKSVCKAAVVNISELCDSSSVCVGCTMNYMLSQTSQQSAVFSLPRGMWRIVNVSLLHDATTACLVIAGGFAMLYVCHSYNTVSGGSRGGLPGRGPPPPIGSRQKFLIPMLH